MNGPKISVLMAVYNEERFLSQAIDSVLSQTFDDFEFIIIDDGSTDRSYSIADSYDDERIRLFRNERNMRLQKSLNRGIEYVRGEYVARMDADDICLPDRFERQAGFLDEHPDISLVASRNDFIDIDGNPLGSSQRDEGTITNDQIRSYLPKRNCISHGSVMIRTNVLKRYRYNERILTSEDYLLWLKILAAGGKIEKIDKILYRMRIHKSSVTQNWGKRYHFQIAGHRSWVYLLYFFHRIRKFKFNRFDVEVSKGMMNNIKMMIMELPKDIKRIVFYRMYLLKKYLVSMTGKNND